MANEASVQVSLRITKGSLRYQSLPQTFNADVDTSGGPTPGTIAVAVTGTSVDLSALATPGLCRLMNLDDTNFVEYGIWDPEGSTFYPLGEIQPGETYVLRLSRYLQEEFGTGTGTTGADTNRLRLKADTAACDVLIEAFEA